MLEKYLVKFGKFLHINIRRILIEKFGENLNKPERNLKYIPQNFT